MARDISDVLQISFRNTDGYAHCHDNANIPYSRNVKHMEIPIKDDMFELPLFAIPSFLNAIAKENNEVDALVVFLRCTGGASDYKTVERCMKDILTECYRTTKLAVVEAKNGNETVLYYGTQGAIFNKDFEPVAMCAWQIERRHVDIAKPNGSTEQKIRYKFIKPLLRVSPDVYVSKSDSMEKFIVNKLITACLDIAIYPPVGTDIRAHFLSSPPVMKAKVEIDSCPYRILTADSPSISTSNKDLLQVALDHIEEVLQ